MWSAGRRRLSNVRALRVTQAPANVTTMSASIAPVRVGPVAHAALRPTPQHQQIRTFFGLKDLLFGDKKEDTPVVADKAVEKTTTTSKVAAPIAAAPAVGVEDVVAEKLPLVGSTDTINYSIGKYARLADGAIMGVCGKTMVLTTAVSMSGGNNRKRDFLPLMVDYRIKYHAAGLIPETARRNEMSGTDEEILHSRVIDRVIRPLFPRDYVDDTQVIATVQSLDPNNDPIVLAINSTSAALAVSDIPWNGPVGCVRVVEIDGQLIVNPTSAQRDQATLDILYAANESRTLMIEASGEQIPEDRMIEALRFAQNAVTPLIEQQKELVKEHGKPKREYTRMVVPAQIMAKAKEIGAPVLLELFRSPKHTKKDRQQGEREAYDAILAGLRAEFEGMDESILQLAAHDTYQTGLRDKILSGERNCRYDGRSTPTIRGLSVETEVLPMAHGSSVFSRGDTQALCSVTLGPLDRGMRVRSATLAPSVEDTYKHAILHYEFPPYCVNETGRVGGINRRMVGHGALAEKAIVPVIPSIDEFPYTVRMTSETMGSDGSSSMATVCGVTMALMDAGVPIKAPVAGISIGLVTDGDPFDGTKEIKNYRLITDILGSEDHYGDMDFKIAGTDAGITAIQLDVKLPGIPVDILCRGIEHAKKARTFILKKMTAALPEPRTQVKSSANGQINVGLKFNVPMGAIGALIGAGGSNIRDLEASTGCVISINRRDGEIHLVGPAENIEAAKATILVQTSTAGFYRAGDKYEMRVTEVMDFGAILESTAPSRNRGFVHITELAHDRVENIHDLIKVGQVLDFECIMEGVSGKMSRKALLPVPAGMEVAASTASAPSSSGPSKRPVSGTTTKRRSKPHPSTGKPASPRSGSSHHRRSPSPYKKEQN
ncbi:hypothetical protein Poli38472_006128 [Pythium oligandrum]|uniref:polyribonucleotide nucleotidyltransferase n=1 Tax=Pythium oligandrum TaxID=41045 RepID=A0A8K1CU08_PYTOL|nr:hypothetical protein Poli38472_006128 [Pythium oligandrum]|eukprot:TMW68660.1 hypothetical protein Poli38472_006128 [Pythium oligandrum]